jgi:hypothetical protein
LTGKRLAIILPATGRINFFFPVPDQPDGDSYRNSFAGLVFPGMHFAIMKNPQKSFETKQGLY